MNEPNLQDQMDNYYKIKEIKELQAKADMYDSLGMMEKAAEVDEVILSLAQPPEYQSTPTYGNQPTTTPQQEKAKKKLTVGQLYQKYIKTLYDMHPKMQALYKEADGLIEHLQAGSEPGMDMDEDDQAVLNLIVKNSGHLAELIKRATYGRDVLPEQSEPIIEE